MNESSNKNRHIALTALNVRHLHICKVQMPLCAGAMEDLTRGEYDFNALHFQWKAFKGLFEAKIALVAPSGGP